MLRHILNEGAWPAMDFYLQRLQNAISSATGSMDPEQLAVRPAEGKWSIAEILEHLYLTYTGTIKGFEKCLAAGKPLARVPTLQDRVRTTLVVKCGYMPEGRKAPQNSVPRGLAPERVLAEVSEKIAAMDAIITEAESKFGCRCRLLDHPILGPLQAREWRKFHWIHGRHHLKQMQRLRNELGGSGYESRATQ
jgi:Protein of unknown function (DUF1569)